MTASELGRNPNGMGGVQTFMWMTEDNIVEVSFDKGIEVVESDLGKRILQLMQLKPSHIVLLAIHQT